MNRITQRLEAITFWQLWLILIIFMLVWRIPYYGKLVLDDPYITFEYATNLAKHGALVFNQGDWVLATTTPVYAILMSIFALVALPLPLVATVLNLVLEGLLLFVVGRILKQVIPNHRFLPLVFVVAGILIITNRAISIASNSGMETILFTLLNMLTLYAVMKKQYIQGTIWGSLATLTRPDGVFALVILGLVIIIQERRLPLREVLLSLAIGAPWVLVATLSYGSFIPHSITAKSAIEHIWFADFATKFFVVFYEPLRFFGIFALLPLCVGIYGAWQKPEGLSLILFTCLHLLYMMLPSNLGFDWYFAPLFTSGYILIAVGLAHMSNSSMRWRFAMPICLIGITLGIGFSSVGNYLSVNRINTIWRQGMLELIADLDENEISATTDVVLQTTNIGIINYYTDFYILDPLGLASPDVVPLIRDADNLQLLPIIVADAFKPTFIVSFGYDDRYSGYSVVAAYPTVDVPLVLYQLDEQN